MIIAVDKTKDKYMIDQSGKGWAMNNDDEETENICNMPEIATVELHRSNDTGNYYLKYLTRFDDDDRCVSGWWRTSAPLPNETVEKIKQFCRGIEMSDETIGEVRGHGDLSGACCDCKQCKYGSST